MKNLEFAISLIFFVTVGQLLAAIGSLCIVVYYLSMLKINVIDKNHNKSWKDYLLSLVPKFLKKKSRY